MQFSTTEQKPHVVCMPYPAQGHIHGMLKLAKLFHYKGFHVTFVHTEFNYNRILTTNGRSSLEGLEGFRFEAIPDGLPPSDAECRNNASMCLSVRSNMGAPLRELLRRMNSPNSGVPPVTCLISDNITSFTLEVSREFGIPNVFFCSASACGYMGIFVFKELVDRGLAPLRSEVDLDNGYLDTGIDWIPGMENIIRLKDLPSFLRTTDSDDILFNFIKDEGQAATQATAIIINTFDELEGAVMDGMSLVLPSIYSIGPLTLHYHEILDESLKTIGSNSLWEEDSSCLKWLDGRAPGSVVYANFGSSTTMSDKQIVELAGALSNSGHGFLWVIRADVVAGGSAVLPSDFLEETKGRGFVTSWCPQERVLMHPAVGAFLSHCGWNSMLESISAGVPVICWPYMADQFINCRYACAEWGIGVQIGDELESEEVERVIREVMGGEKGKEMKREALRWKQAATMATKPGGKSAKNLDKIIEEVILQRSTK